MPMRSDPDLIQNEENIIIDLILFTTYSVILTILFVIWFRTIFFSSSNSLILSSLNKNKRRRKSKIKLNKSCTNISNITTTNYHHNLNKLSPSPNTNNTNYNNYNVASPKLPSPRLSEINHCLSPQTSQNDTNLNVPSINNNNNNNNNEINVFVNSFIPKLSKLQTSNTQSNNKEDDEEEEEEEEQVIGISASMAVDGNHNNNNNMNNNNNNNDKEIKTKKESSKPIKLEPCLQIFGTGSIFFAALYCYLNTVELFLIYNNKYFANKILNMCYIWSINVTPMFFNRLCIYLYLIFRIYFVFNSSIYGVSTLFIGITTCIIIIIFILCYTFFNIYITLIATKCTITNINIALMPSRYFDFIISILLISIFIFKLNKLVKRCDDKINHKTNQFIQRVKYLINKLLILLIVSISGSFASYFLFIFYQETNHNKDHNYFALQSILRFDIIINTICLILSLTAFDTLYKYFCFPFRIICEPSSSSSSSLS